MAPPRRPLRVARPDFAQSALQHPSEPDRQHAFGSDSNKRRKTDTFFRPAQRYEALDPALVQPTSLIQQENNILITQDTGKQYQLAVKDFNVRVRDNRIRAKDERVSELEEENELKDFSLSEALLRKQELIRHAERQELLSEAQAAHIQELMSMVASDRAKLMLQDEEIHILKAQLETQQRYIKNLENRRLLDQVLEYARHLFGWAIESYDRTTIFPLMQLPGELRNNIYKSCLVARRPIDFWPMIAEDAPSGTTRASILQENLKHINVNLLRVSRQVHKETVGILYGCNRFRFSDVGAWTVLEGFLTHLNRNCRHITNISVSCADGVCRSQCTL